MKTFLRGALLAVTAALFLSACDQAAVTVDESPEARADGNGAIIPGHYIVVLDPAAVAGKTALQVVDQVVADVSVAPEYRYGATLAGFAATLDGNTLQALRGDPRVAYIEPDRVITLPPFTVMGGGDVGVEKGKPGSGGGGGSASQSTPWGVARTGGAGSGAALRVCVLDTGVDLDHPDLNVSTSGGFNAFTSGRDAGSLDDGNGHGTHVSGTIGAIDNSIGVVGVAAGATIVPVKVLNSQGSGSFAGVIAGIDHVGSGAANCSVANMSLGGSFSQAVNDAVVAASSTVRFALAAGNETADASTKSPASAEGPRIYTIAAFASGDVWASYSNYGAPVDFAAPGSGIPSTWKGGGYNTISGTSMATPHVAGILALGNVAMDGQVCRTGSDCYPIAHR